MKLYLAPLLAVTFAAYSSSLFVPFVYDDTHVILGDTSVTGKQPITLHGERSVLTTTYRINYALGKDNPFGYHVVNLGLHLVNTLLVFGVLLSLGCSSWAALLGAAFFSLHPIQSESVIYVSARSELLSCSFGLLGMLAFQRKRYVWMSVAFVFAIFSKEIAIVFPLMFAFYALLTDKRSWKYVIPVGSLAISLGSIFVGHLEEPGRGWFDHFAIQSGQFVRLLTLIVYPGGQTIDHDAETLSRAFLGLSMVLLTLLIAIMVWFREKYPQVSIGVGWMLIAVSPRFVVNNPEFMQELHMMTPMIGISLIVASVFSRKERLINGNPYSRVSETAMEC